MDLVVKIDHRTLSSSGRNILDSLQTPWVKGQTRNRPDGRLTCTKSEDLGEQLAVQEGKAGDAVFGTAVWGRNSTMA